MDVNITEQNFIKIKKIIRKPIFSISTKCKQIPWKKRDWLGSFSQFQILSLQRYSEFTFFMLKVTKFIANILIWPNTKRHRNFFSILTGLPNIQFYSLNSVFFHFTALKRFFSILKRTYYPPPSSKYFFSILQRTARL